MNVQNVELLPYKKAIHLLYVPTIFCNMGCKYCYLGDLTEEKIDPERAVTTLTFALKSLLSAGYLPFNLSFHGGEVTALPSKTLRKLFQIAQQHYFQESHAIKQMGHQVNPIHIKTNLYSFSKHYDLLNEFKVSISASVDLPLRLHELYRVDKKGKSTLKRMESNLRLLVKYPHKKKLSCVVTQAHWHSIDQFIEDIWYLNNDIGLDMKRFNIMFSFDSEKNQQKFDHPDDNLNMLSQEQQLAFYQRLKEAFKHTELESAISDQWFAEFTPDYCCSAVNCGDKFFLLQDDGDVFSCPRGQSSKKFHYGNLFTSPIETIINNGSNVIERNENTLDMSQACQNCQYVHYCHVGCTFVRTESVTDKSYTCSLQQAIYEDNPTKYPPLKQENIKPYVKNLLLRNNVKQLKKIHPKKESTLTPELFTQENQLSRLISQDNILQEVYSDRLFQLNIDGIIYPLSSQILKNSHDIEYLSKNSHIQLGIKSKL